MIVSLRHTGFVVRNLELMLEFYMKIGFKLSHRDLETGPFISQVVGIDQVEIETAKLSAPCGGVIELLKYHSHPIEKQVSCQPPNQLGCSHVALTVESIDDTLRWIEKNGGQSLNTGILSHNKQVRVAYCYDPEGNLLEVVENVPQ